MKKQQVDMSSLAEEPQLEDYEQKPVQNYGMALLKGMGFSQSKGIGRSRNNQLNDIYVLKPRPRGQGLGAQTLEQVEKQKFEVGDKILITQQAHKGLTGYVNEILNEDHLSIELHPSKSVVRINIKALKKISKSEMKKIQQQASKAEDKQSKKKKRIKWVVPQIRVKVTDPKSQFYLKKVIVSQLISDRQFQCRDQTGKILNNLSQKDIQTVIPKNGGTVIILKGEHIGAKATVMDRKKSKGEVTIQTEQELQMIKLSQDDISQYVEI